MDSSFWTLLLLIIRGLFLNKGKEIYSLEKQIDIFSSLDFKKNPVKVLRGIFYNKFLKKINVF